MAVGLGTPVEKGACVRGSSGRTPNGRNALGDRGVAQHVVRTRRFFGPPGVEGSEVLHPRDGLIDIPDLVGIDHELAVGPDLFTHDAQAPDIVL